MIILALNIESYHCKWTSPSNLTRRTWGCLFQPKNLASFWTQGIHFTKLYHPFENSHKYLRMPQGGTWFFRKKWWNGDGLLNFPTNSSLCVAQSLVPMCWPGNTESTRSSSINERSNGKGFQRFSSWWLNQPIWKTLVKIGSSSTNRGENKTYFKPPSFFLNEIHFPLAPGEAALHQLMLTNTTCKVVGISQQHIFSNIFLCFYQIHSNPIFSKTKFRVFVFSKKYTISSLSTHLPNWFLLVFFFPFGKIRRNHLGAGLGLSLLGPKMTTQIQHLNNGNVQHITQARFLLTWTL